MSQLFQHTVRRSVECANMLNCKKNFELLPKFPTKLAVVSRRLQQIYAIKLVICGEKHFCFAILLIPNYLKLSQITNLTTGVTR